MKYLRYGLKALGWLALVLCVLTAIGLAALIAANWSDDALSEAAQQALHYAPPTEQALEGNGYLIVMGLDAPAEGDAVAEAMALGRKRLAREIERRRWVEAHGAELEGMPPSVASVSLSQIREVFPDRLRCPIEEADCFAWFIQHGDAIQALAKNNQSLLHRLQAAANAPQYSNPVPFYLQAEYPPFGLLVRAHELWLAQAALQWMHGQPDQAMHTVGQAIQLRSRLAGRSNSLIAAMVALALQHRELRWLSNANTHGRLALPAFKGIEELLTQPPPSLRQALNGEKQFTAGVFYSMQHADSFITHWDDHAEWWQRLWNRASQWGYLPHQTLNMSIRHLEQVQVISDLPAHQVEPAFLEAMRQWDIDAACTPWKRLRNIAGTCLAAMALPSYQGYIQKVADMDGYRRLVLLQHHATAERVASNEMPDWLAQSPQALRNPYTQQPMQWDAATSSLVFEGRERQYQNPDQSPTYRIRLRY